MLTKCHHGAITPLPALKMGLRVDVRTQLGYVSARVGQGYHFALKVRGIE